MTKIVRLTESDLISIVKRVLKEETKPDWPKVSKFLNAGKFEDYKLDKNFASRFDKVVVINPKKIRAEFWEDGWADIYDTTTDEYLGRRNWNWDGTKITLTPFTENTKSPEWINFKKYFDTNTLSGVTGVVGYDKKSESEILTFDGGNGYKLVFYPWNGYKLYQYNQFVEYGVYVPKKEGFGIRPFMISKITEPGISFDEFPCMDAPYYERGEKDGKKCFIDNGEDYSLTVYYFLDGTFLVDKTMQEGTWVCDSSGNRDVSQFPFQLMTVKTNGSNLNVREKGSKNSKIVGKIPNRTQILVWGYNGPSSNYYVEYYGPLKDYLKDDMKEMRTMSLEPVGYVSAKYLTVQK